MRIEKIHDRGQDMQSNDAFGRLSKSLAVRMDRRGFVRKAGRGIFATTALLAAGGVAEVTRATPAFAYASSCASSEGDRRGAGCPGGGHWGSRYPCGPSRCCTYTSGRPAGCNCSNLYASFCKNNGGRCRNLAGTWGGASCWTCQSPSFGCGVGCTCVYQTTCCDCRTSGCDSDNICISNVTSTVVLHC